MEIIRCRFNATDLGTSSAYDVRKHAVLAASSAGALGQTYGCHDILADVRTKSHSGEWSALSVVCSCRFARWQGQMEYIGGNLIAVGDPGSIQCA
ncbi:MAG: hypothetical protein U5K79_03465 [Cyclobacteriaceae bacterium]|nr:hypothetical protein [Cyclobacteriaceae bacterium]